MHSNAKQKKKAWSEAQRQTRQIKDKLGMPVDKAVIEMVAILRLLDFCTVGSCAGHIRRATGGPYITIESPKANLYATRARATDNTQDEAYRKLRKKANYWRVHDLNRLLNYLEDFYEHRHVNYYNHLIVQSMPMTLNVLTCQGAELTLIGGKKRKEIVENNQAEMKVFAEYLKDRYLNECPENRYCT